MMYVREAGYQGKRCYERGIFQAVKRLGFPVFFVVGFAGFFGCCGKQYDACP